MTNANAPTNTEAESRPSVTADQYAAFIRQIELAALWLHDAHIQNHAGPDTPERAVIAIASDAEWADQGDGFRVLHHYHVSLMATDTALAGIDVTFGLRFTSASPMTDAIFGHFEEVNLPVNTWPYLREFVATTLGRMNWLPFTLPALKRGAGSNTPATSTERPRAPRGRTTKRAVSFRRAGGAQSGDVV